MLNSRNLGNTLIFFLRNLHLIMHPLFVFFHSVKLIFPNQSVWRLYLL